LANERFHLREGFGWKVIVSIADLNSHTGRGIAPLARTAGMQSAKALTQAISMLKWTNLIMAPYTMIDKAKRKESSTSEKFLKIKRRTSKWLQKLDAGAGRSNSSFRKNLIE
jgi:hypothetical protein